MFVYEESIIMQRSNHNSTKPACSVVVGPREFCIPQGLGPMASNIPRTTVFYWTVGMHVHRGGDIFPNN